MRKFKISSRLYIFVVLALIATILVEYIGIQSVHKLSDQINDTYEYSTQYLGWMGEAKGAYNGLKVTLFDLILDDEMDEELFQNGDAFIEQYAATVTNYYNSLLAANEDNENIIEYEFDHVSALYDSIPVLYNAYTQCVDNIRNGSKDKALDILRTDIRTLSDETVLPSLEWLISNNIVYAYNMNMQANDLKNIRIKTMLFIFAFSIIIFVVYAKLTVSSITKPIKKLVTAAEEIANGNLDVQITSNAQDELGLLAKSFDTVAQSINRIIDDIFAMSQAHDAGDIDFRIDSMHFKGDYKKVCDGINFMIASYVDVFVLIVKCFNNIGEGNFDVEITDLPGKKNALNQALNTVKHALNDVIESLNTLIHAASEGDLSQRVNSAKYAGDWATIIDDLNNLMNIIAQPIFEASDVLGQMAQGTLGAQMQGNYNGQFKLIKTSVNTTSDSITSYLSEINHILSSIANKDLTQHISREFIGDYSKLKDSINSIIAQLNLIITNILSVSNEVNTGAKMVSDTSMLLAQGSTEQAATVREFSRSMEDISQKINCSVSNANKANGLSLKTRENVDHCNTSMVEMLNAMNGIKTASDNISQVVKVINDIAFQTNILSLNASVEAARAGEHGKGFNVVANEVRMLATKCQDAVEETRLLIDDANTKVENGLNLANSTFKALEEIITNILTITEVIADINIQSIEQDQDISEMNTKLTQFMEVINQNSANSEATASASQELSSQSDILDSLVNTFHIKI